MSGDDATELTDAYELLNAYLDGEVSDQERAEVEEALEADAGIRAELHALHDTRQRVRELPLLEMPDDFGARIARRSPFGPVARPRRRSRTRALAVSAAASVAFWGAVATSGGANVVVPDIASIVGAHSAVILEEEHPAVDPSVMFTAPDGFEGFSLVYARRHGNLAHAMYTDGVRDISLFEQPGRIDWDRLPGGGQLTLIGSDRAWTGMVAGQTVTMVEREGMVYAIVASADAPMDDMSTAMPGDSDGWFDHVRRASRRTIDFFSFSS